MNPLDISKCRLDAVSGARHLACFLVNGAGCSFAHGVFTVSTCGMAAPIGSGLGPTQYKRGLGVRVCAGAYKSNPCPCGDQPVPPAGDRAVTPRPSEPPRMPKPARCGRRCLICNRRVLLRCGRCGRTTAGYDGLCAVSSCARHRPASLHAIGTSRRLQSRCAVRSRLWLHSCSGQRAVREPLAIVFA